MNSIKPIKDHFLQFRGGAGHGECKNYMNLLLANARLGNGAREYAFVGIYIFNYFSFYETHSTDSTRIIPYTFLDLVHLSLMFISR